MSRAAAKKDARFHVEAHFGFGENWADFARHVTEAEIARAEEGLLRLLPAEELRARSFLDIGCGSGLHSLAALRQGAASAVCVDFDPDSVKTTGAVLKRFWPRDNYRAQEENILKPASLQGQQFDIVYSWGVLHHTGAMRTALENAAAMVKPGGLLVIALYKKTPLCGFWKIEKIFYTALPKFLRLPFDYAYAGLYCLGLLASGKNPLHYIRDYRRQRGMHFMTDVRDWLGGYPYESISPHEAQAFIEGLGFQLLKSFNTQPMKLCGLFGSGCAEYVFRKNG